MSYWLTRLQPRLLCNRKLIMTTTPLSFVLMCKYTTHTASLCVISDEILNGKTFDTNSNYLGNTTVLYILILRYNRVILMNM
jgi:hypothetical protein